VDIPGIAALCAAAFATGFSKAGVPGVGILAPVLAALALPARASTGLLLPVLIEGDLLAVGYWRRKANKRRLLAVLPWAGLGIVAGYFLMGIASDALFKPLLGAMILAILALDVARRAAKVEIKVGSPPIAAAVGVLAGIFTMMANAAGPIMTIYLLSMGLEKEDFVGTSAWFFFAVNLFKLPFSASLGLITLGSLGFDLALLPLVALGSFAGILAMRRLPQKAFNIIAQALAALGGLRLLF
jgi:uncharacterized membrane protein YfcA